MNDFNITLFETCELLNRSKKSISRYIRRGLLHPERVKSQQGTLEYRFSKEDIEAFKTQEALKAEEARQDRTEETDQTEETGHIHIHSSEQDKSKYTESRQDTPDQTGQRRQDRVGQDSEVITLLKETTGLLKEQLGKKDEQIKDLGGKIDQLIERDRETNILLKGLQDKILLLEKPKGKDKKKKKKAETIEPDKWQNNSHKGVFSERGDDEPEDALKTAGKQQNRQAGQTDKEQEKPSEENKEKSLWKKILNID